MGGCLPRAYVPFKAICLPQAIAAKLMLERRGVASSLHLGAALHTRSGKAFEAHAWLDAVMPSRVQSCG